MRAGRIPICMVAIAVSTAPARVAKAQMPTAVASGIPYTRSVTSVITPSVPSEPTSRWVRS